MKADQVPHDSGTQGEPVALTFRFFFLSQLPHIKITLLAPIGHSDSSRPLSDSGQCWVLQHTRQKTKAHFECTWNCQSPYCWLSASNRQMLWDTVGKLFHPQALWAESDWWSKHLWGPTASLFSCWFIFWNVREGGIKKNPVSSVTSLKWKLFLKKIVFHF